MINKHEANHNSIQCGNSNPVANSCTNNTFELATNPHPRYPATEHASAAIASAHQPASLLFPHSVLDFSSPLTSRTMSLVYPSTSTPSSRYWWHTATIYELYPSSFKDSNGDGIGDIPGIISKIPYLASLGIDAVWLAACYKSGGVDMGYDVVDYRDIDPQYGTVSDIEKLTEELDKVGIRLIMDMVVNHTSHRHPWFMESRLLTESDKRQWYIWRKGKTSVQVDGTTKRTPPNNWSSVFGGPAWTYDEVTDEWYLHIFAKEQPDLNWANRKVRVAIYEDMRSWLDMGVAGFRMDVINLISKPENLEDLDAAVVDPEVVEQPAFDLICNGSRIHDYLQEMRRVVLDPFSTEPDKECMMVGEVICTSDPSAIRQYTEPHRKELSMAYQYDLFEWLHCGPKGKFSAYNPPIPLDKTLSGFKNIITYWQTSLQHHHGGWGTIWLESHDTARSVSRFLDLTAPHLSVPEQHNLRCQVSKLLCILQTTLGGTLFIYQGQELGLTNLSPSIPISEYQDVESRLAWETEYHTLLSLARLHPTRISKAEIDMSDFESQIRLKARDHARTPLPWTPATSASPHAGFSDAPKEVQMWSPMNTDSNSAECNIADQDLAPNSTLNFWRKSLLFRKSRPETLVFGSFEAVPILPEDDPRIFAYWRRGTSSPTPSTSSSSSKTTAANIHSKAEADNNLLIVMNLSAEEGVEVHLPRIPGVEKHDGKLAMYEWVAGTDEKGKTARERVVRNGGRVVLGRYEGIVLAC
ncbi:putative glycosyl hydrolase, family 13, catalytic domain, glycoside hydrolase superfamily [Septoria linicola]|nr:putative glycosyl hydrolase, family 13, catalytic domain, glycoside hydrolase superfamily [Septoria linicola]